MTFNDVLFVFEGGGFGSVAEVDFIILLSGEV